MPISNKASDLLSNGKLNYGDPCYQADWNSTIDECARHGSLAQLVFDHYGIAHQAAPHNDWTHCCPLDIINQDPFSCIKMSLEAMLLSGQYWEAYADEFGRARFVQLLEGSSEAGPAVPLYHIQYCLPTIQTQDLVDMVIVKAAQPPPMRRCGTDWFTIVDRSMNINTTTIRDLGGVFPMGNNPAQGAMPPAAQSSFGPISLQGMKFSWGHVNGHASVSTDVTCDHGVFAQYGCVIYPDFQRKQSFRDEYVDVAEVQGYETILFWLMDVDYGIDASKLKHYNVQFTKSTEIPAKLTIHKDYGSVSDYFGPTCDLGQGTGTTPNTYTKIDVRSSTSEESCTSIEAGTRSARANKDKGKIYWDECSIPSFYGYAYADSRLNFLDISKWSVGSNLCVDDQFADNMYETTTSLMANGCSLEGFKKAMKPGWSSDFIDIGWQKDRRTFDLPQSAVWVEFPHDVIPQGIHGNLYYALRAKAPDSGTWCTNWQSSNFQWVNPYQHLMMELVGCRWQGSAMSNNAGSFSWPSPCGGRSTPFIDLMPWIATYKPPGYLMSLGDEGLYTVDELWAKISVSRPGVVVKGMGAAADTFLDAFSLRALPVYQVDFPAPTAAAGGQFGMSGFKINPDNDLFDNMYCTVEDKKTDSEILQEACTGNILEMTFPFLYPHVKTGSTESPRGAFDKVTDQCLEVARNLWGYFYSYHDMPNKNMTFICGPPETQEELPYLGQMVSTDHGPRTVNSISYSYSDQSNFSVTVEVGPVNLSQASAGTISRKRIKTEDVRGRIISHEYGALYKVDVPGIGVIKAWNIDHYPWNAGDRVQVQLYNNPQEL
jgi:hypothetical protein